MVGNVLNRLEEIPSAPAAQMKSRLVRVWLLVQFLALASCVRSSSAVELTGVWVSEPIETQLGMATEMVCFSQGSQFTRITRSQAGTMSHKGTYELVGDALTIRFADTAAPASFRAKSQSGTLILGWTDGKSREYRKSNTPCEL